MSALKWAEHCPDPRLLDVGHTASLLWLRPAFAVFSDLEGSGWLTPADLAGAEPDPFCHLERSWLQHLDQTHPDVLRTLASRIFAPLRLGESPDPAARHRSARSAAADRGLQSRT
ncbi:MAG: hypothetical protein ACRDTG_17695 [Pseudonocardiaceae bacterium]